MLPAWDFITGAYCAFALMAALHHRAATGEGSEVRVPLGDVAIGTVANSGALAEMLYRGADRPRLGNAIWGALGRDFVSRDGKRFMVAVLTPNQWTAMVAALEIAAPVAALEAETGRRIRPVGSQPLRPPRGAVRHRPAGRGRARLRRSRRAG